ncbi:hypothetical protein ATANTOWER_007719 [Ataeniobius toweri]|uniref:Uncharacterized protein n=1 Tax=Ataeniobius toweri TaxID=208326 RepID=A0ABU7CB76_9TELE|nr:hypothetical protein [Ataeniobius toweri]
MLEVGTSFSATHYGRSVGLTPVLSQQCGAPFLSRYALGILTVFRKQIASTLTALRFCLQCDLLSFLRPYRKTTTYILPQWKYRGNNKIQRQLHLKPVPTLKAYLSAG